MKFRHLNICMSPSSEGTWLQNMGRGLDRFVGDEGIRNIFSCRDLAFQWSLEQAANSRDFMLILGWCDGRYIVGRFAHVFQRVASPIAHHHSSWFHSLTSSLLLSPSLLRFLLTLQTLLSLWLVVELQGNPF